MPPRTPERAGSGWGVTKGFSRFTLIALGLQLGLSPTRSLAQSWSSMSASRVRGNETELDVSVRYGVGRFTISAAEPPRLYQIQLRYDENAFGPVHEYRDGRLVVGIDGNEGSSPFGRGSSEGGLDLALSTEIPMDLELEFGAVRADLDLGGLRLRSLDLTTGASEAELRVSRPNPEAMEVVSLAVGAASFRARELGNLNAEEVTVEAGVGDVRLDFSGLQRTETRIDVEMGLGNLEIQVPSEAGVRLTRESFLTVLEAPGLERGDDAYVSANWASSAMRVTIDVEAAFGKVSVLRTD